MPKNLDISGMPHSIPATAPCYAVGGEAGPEWGEQR
jgi:hypothetical protein